MSIVKRAVLLLLLLVALCTDAAPTAEECAGLNKTLPTKDLNTIFRDWFLVWFASEDPRSLDLVGNLSSSHIELKLLPDNKTIVFLERIVFLDKSCASYLANMSMPSDADDVTLIADTAMLEKDGDVHPFELGSLDFYKSCSDCLMFIYRGSIGRYLLIFRTEGQHGDVEQLKAAHSDHKKQAECLGFAHGQMFGYDGAADFCQKKSSTAEQSNMRDKHVLDIS